jgi:deoxyhypusine monooxygenase
MYTQNKLAETTENPMVRHECAETLGAIAAEPCSYILRQYLHDKDQVVRESCEVALDMADYEHSGLFQYAAIE